MLGCPPTVRGMRTARPTARRCQECPGSQGSVRLPCCRVARDSRWPEPGRRPHAEMLQPRCQNSHPRRAPVVGRPRPPLSSPAGPGTSGCVRSMLTTHTKAPSFCSAGIPESAARSTNADRGRLRHRRSWGRRRRRSRLEVGASHSAPCLGCPPSLWSTRAGLGGLH